MNDIVYVVIELFADDADVVCATTDRELAESSKNAPDTDGTRLIEKFENGVKTTEA